MDVTAASRRRDRTAEIVGGLVYVTLSLFMAAFWLMISEGALASDFGWPTFSYWQSVLVVFALGSVMQYGGSNAYWRDRKRRQQ